MHPPVAPRRVGVHQELVLGEAKGIGEENLEYVPSGFQVVTNTKTVVIIILAVFLDSVTILKRDGLALCKFKSCDRSYYKAIVQVCDFFPPG